MIQFIPNKIQMISQYKMVLEHIKVRVDSLICQVSNTNHLRVINFCVGLVYTGLFPDSKCHLFRLMDGGTGPLRSCGTDSKLSKNLKNIQGCLLETWFGFMLDIILQETASLPLFALNKVSSSLFQHYTFALLCNF